jgi:hypothetical protein
MVERRRCYGCDSIMPPNERLVRRRVSVGSSQGSVSFSMRSWSSEHYRDREFCTPCARRIDRARVARRIIKLTFVVALLAGSLWLWHESNMSPRETSVPPAKMSPTRRHR